MSINAVKVASAGIAGAGGSGGAVYGTYYLVTSSKSSSEAKQEKETKPKFKALEKWTRDNKRNITSVEDKRNGQSNTISFSDLDETMSESLLTWIQEKTNKTTITCPADPNNEGTTAVTVELKTDNGSSFSKK